MKRKTIIRQTTAVVAVAAFAAMSCAPVHAQGRQDAHVR